MTPSYLVGLIGAGIGTSLSPALHEREAHHHGLRYLYRLVDLAGLGLGPESAGDLVRAARRLGFDGLNITHPCKQTVIAHLDELSVDAATLGAVNTVTFEGERAIGHNTDWIGFAESFARGLPDAATRRVVQLGAGGAGAATAHALLTLGADHLTVADLDPSRARGLADALVARFGPGRASTVPLPPPLPPQPDPHGQQPDPSGPPPVTRGPQRGGAGEPGERGEPADGRELAELLRAADGLVHATPTGMARHPGLPLPAGLLHPGLWVADIVYRPLDTELLRTARALGCRTLDGGGMVVFQAAHAFRLFTGAEPDTERMLAHLTTLVTS
ncbi:shikimate dehydrogenase [Nonomuraea muscovyensis]